jgi:hypothetical protein
VIGLFISLSPKENAEVLGVTHAFCKRAVSLEDVSDQLSPC